MIRKAPIGTHNNQDRLTPWGGKLWIRGTMRLLRRLSRSCIQGWVVLVTPRSFSTRQDIPRVSPDTRSLRGHESRREARRSHCVWWDCVVGIVERKWSERSCAVGEMRTGQLSVRHIIWHIRGALPIGWLDRDIWRCFQSVSSPT